MGATWIVAGVFVCGVLFAALRTLEPQNRSPRSLSIGLPDDIAHAKTAAPERGRAQAQDAA